MAFNAEGGSFGPSRRTHEYRADPYSLGAIRESAFNMASRIFRSVETWIRSEPNSDPLPWADRGSDPALDGLLRAQASPFGIRSRSDDKVDQEESQLKRPSPLQVEAGGLRMAGAPRGLPFRHPDTPCQSSLTARPVHQEITKGTLLGPLDEVLARYVQDRTGGSEGMHVFNFNAKERLDFEAKIGRDLARLAKSSRPGRSSVFDTVVSAPRPALDVWSAPPRGFCLGGVVAPPELPPAAKRRKVNASSLRRITAADESDDIVEVAESVPPSDDVEVVEAPKSDKKTIAVKSAPKRPKKASVEAEVVEVGEKEVKKVTTDEDFWRVQIEAIYRRRNPHRLAQVASLMEKHKGKELILYQQVCQRYDLNPKKFYADPKSWESEDKDVKDDDDAPEVSQSGVPSSKGLIEASAPPSSGKPVFGASGSAALFGKEASSGSSLLFDIPPAPTDPDKKINIFASGTQAEKRFATADSGSPFGSENSSSLFASSGASSGGLFSLAPAGEPSEEPKPAFPPTPLFGSSETTDVPSVPNLFGSDPGSKEVKSSTTPGSGFGGIFGGSAASTGASVFGSSSGSLFGGSSSSTSIFGSSKESSGANLFGSAEASSGSPKEASSDSAGGIFTFGLSKESKEPEKQSPANIFGSSSGSSVGNLFGSGSGAPATSLFSASSSASSGASLFGSASASSSSKGFGESSKESSGGSIFASGSLSFGTSSSSSAVGLFGTGAVGNEPPKAKQSTGSIFLSPTTDGNLFGTSNSSASAGSLFGGSSSSTSIFGSSKESSGANLFGSAKASSGSAKEASSDSAGGIFTFGFGKESKEPEKQSPANIFGSSSGSSVGNLFGNKVEDQSKGPGQFGADATFGRQISALSDPFGLNAAEEPTNKRRASLESEETGNEPRRKADPEVLAKRKIVRGRRSVVSSVKREEAPIAEFPPQPPPGGLFQTDISGGFPPQPPAELLAVSTPLETSKAPEPQKAEKEETKEGPTPGVGAADTGEGDEAPVKIDNQVDFWRVQIEAIYRRRNPIKLKEVSSLMEKHKGQEVILFKKVCKRYDLDPSKIYTREDAWEGEGKEFKDDPDDEGAASAAASAPIASASAPIASIFGDSTATSGGSIFSAATGGSSLFTSAGGTGSLFGASSGGSLFGSGTKDLFGGTSSSSSLGSSIFGTTSSSSAGKSLFGSASSSSFGDSGAFAPGKSLFDGSGNSASKIFEGGNLFAGGSSNLFGSGSGSSTGSLFGAPSASSSSGSSSGSIFGAPGAPPPSTGSIFCGSAERSASGSPFGGDAAALFGSSAGSGSDNIFAFGASGVPTAGSNKKKRRAE